MYSVDIQPTPNLTEATGAVAVLGIDHRFLMADSATVRLPRPVDLLFIDTWHVFGQLRRELHHHQASVRRYILLHDTEVDHDDGESVRRKHDVDAESRRTGYPAHEIRLGLWPAVEEFLARHPEWELKTHYTNNNGLTVLRRVGGYPFPAPRCPRASSSTANFTWGIFIVTLVIVWAFTVLRARTHRL